jgi:anti-sigma B factor antagonist
MPDRPGPWPLVVEVDRPAPAAVTVEVLGEIDLATAPVLQERLESLLDTGVQDMILDLRGVPFCDVPGLNVLMRVQTQLWSRGGQLTVLGPSRTLRVMAAVLGLTECLHLMPAPGADPTDPADRADENGAGTT